MHWLQSLDTGLFHFINRSLSNPLFDWLMPLLSGGNGAMRWFVLFVVVAALAALCFGNARARLCATLMVLVVVLGDPLIVNTIKHAIARPRPFVTLPDARVFGVVGQGYVPPTEISAHTPGLNSMPSAHAANWFAATMIAFLFYRRRAWPMLVMALAVSFSRLYNGVHYPSDVLTGAILGAGYAAALAVALEVVWRRIGQDWLPLWHAQMPSLLNPVHSPQSTVPSPEPQTAVQPSTLNSQPSTLNSQLSTINSHWLRLGYFLIFVMLVGRWIYVAGHTIDLEKDEAYQWLWSKHLALSYYSKPVGIALIQWVSTSLFGDTQFGVRFFSPLFAAILSVLLLRFMTREVGGRASFALLLIATATPLLGLGTILMTIDPPLVLCWMWAVVAGWRAVAATPSSQNVAATPSSQNVEATPPSLVTENLQQRGRCLTPSGDGASPPQSNTRDWLIAGLAMGLGFLCKYTAICQLVCWALFFALWRPARVHLRRPGPWLGLLVFLICTLPVVIWNAQHGWITVQHVAGDAAVGSAWHPTLRYFWDFLFTQAGLLNPFFFGGMLWAMFAFWRRWRERPLWLYLFCMGAPVYLGYWLYSFHSRILPNWPVVGVLPLFCLAVAYWDERPRLSRPFTAVGLALGFFVVAMMYQANLIGRLTGEPLPGEKDPSRRVRAWRPTAEFVEAAREKLAAEGKPAFIIADHYGMTGLFSFYLPQAHAALKSSPLVYCVDTDGPVNQFYFWPEYNYRANRKGQNAIFVSELDPYPLEKGWFGKWLAHEPVKYGEIPPPMRVPQRIADEFESVTDLGEHEIYYGNRIFRRVHLWACYDLK